MHFSLVKIRPQNKRLHSAFDNYDGAIFPMYYALKRLGFEVEILVNKTNPHSRNIIFGSWFVAKDIGNLIPKDSILYNLEQMVPNGFLRYPEYLAHLRDFDVWDYSEENIKTLQEKDIQATFVPLGYVPEMSRLKSRKTLDIDLLFYEEVTDCRKVLLDQIQNTDIQLHIDPSAYGTRRDILISRSKAVLNVHSFYVPVRLEELHLGYLWANKIPVISEIRDDTSVPEHLKEACFYASYDNILEEAKKFIFDEKKLSQQGNAGFLAFSSKPLDMSLKVLIGGKTYSCANDAVNSNKRDIINLESLFPSKKTIFLESILRNKSALEAFFRKKLEKHRKKMARKQEVVSQYLPKEPVYNGTGPDDWVIKSDMSSNN